MSWVGPLANPVQAANVAATSIMVSAPCFASWRVSQPAALASAERVSAAEPLASQPAMHDRLRSVSWQVVSLRGDHLALPQPLVLNFLPDGLLEGHTGCNRLAAEYRLEGSSLRLVGLRRTQQICDASSGQRQQTLMQVLQGLQSIAFDADGRLILYSTEGTLAAIARAP